MFFRLFYDWVNRISNTGNETPLKMALRKEGITLFVPSDEAIQRIAPNMRNTITRDFAKLGEVRIYIYILFHRFSSISFLILSFSPIVVYCYFYCCLRFLLLFVLCFISIVISIVILQLSSIVFLFLLFLLFQISIVIISIVILLLFQISPNVILCVFLSIVISIVFSD